MTLRTVTYDDSKFKIVPIEPTLDMVFATTHINNSIDNEDLFPMLRFAIKAAPEFVSLAQQAIDPFELVYCALKGSDSTHGLASCDDFKNWKASLSALAQQASEEDDLRVTKQIEYLFTERDNSKLRTVELENGLREIAEWTERYTAPNHPISTIARRLLTPEGGDK